MPKRIREVSINYQFSWSAGVKSYPRAELSLDKEQIEEFVVAVTLVSENGSGLVSFEKE